jgi:hypothetical protein
MLEKLTQYPDACEALAKAVEAIDSDCDYFRVFLEERPDLITPTNMVARIQNVARDALAAFRADPPDVDRGEALAQAIETARAQWLGGPDEDNSGDVIDYADAIDAALAAFRSGKETS